MNIVHRPGRVHKNADGMSRIQCKQCGMDTEMSEEPDLTISLKSEMIAQVTESEIIDIRTIQDNDSEISQVKRWIKSKERPEKNQVQGKGYLVINDWFRLVFKTGFYLLDPILIYISL